MKNKLPFYIAGATIGTVMLFSLLWEFVLESPIMGNIFPLHADESLSQQLEFIVTATFFSAISLVLPLYFLIRSIERRERVVEALSRRNQEIISIFQSSRDTTQTDKFDSFANELFEACKRSIGATAGYVALLSADGEVNEVRYLDSGGISCTVNPDLPMPIRGLRETAYRTGEVVYDNDFHHGEWNKLMPTGHVRLDNVLFSPIMVDGKAAGLIGLGNKPGGFNQSDTKIAASFGELASIALKDIHVSEALHKSELQHRRLVETIPHGIQECDSSGIITFSNTALDLMFGYGDEGLMGRSILELTETEAEKEQLGKYLSNLLQEQPEPSPYFAKNLRKDGRIIDVRVDWDYKRGSQGEIIGFISTITDITESKRAEQALQLQSEIVSNMAEGVYLIRAADGQIVYTNPKFAEMFGYEPEELVGRHVSMVNAPTDESPEEIAKEIIATLKREGSWGGEVLNLKKDGTTFWCHAKVATFDHPEFGGVWIAVHTDITERVEAETALRESEEGYRRIVETAEEGIWVIDTEGKTTFANRRMGEMLGCPVEELMEASMFDFMDDEAKRNAEVKLERRRENITESHTFKFRRKDGSELWTLINTNPLKNDQGKVIGALGMVSDITEIRRTQEALRVSEEKYRDLVETSVDMIWRADNEARFSYLNPAWEKVLGYEHDEMIGRPFTDFKPPEERERNLQKRKEILKGGHLSGFETVYLTKNGEERILNFNAKALKDAAGATVGTQGTAQDITDRKRAEEALQANNKMLEVIGRAQSGFILSGEPTEFFEHLLHEILELAHSEYGFIGELHDPEDKPPYLEIHAISSVVRKEELRVLYEEYAESGLIFSNLETLYGAVMSTGKVVIANDPANDPRSGGLPKGHPELNSFLGLPLNRGGRIVGVVGIANRPGGFDEQIALELQPFLLTSSQIIEAYRLDRLRREAEERTVEALAEKEVLLREVHHRVKNNLQVILSLLHLQADHTEELGAKEAFRDSRTRIGAMALVHESLYRFESLAAIDLQGYLTKLGRNLLAAYGIRGDRIHLEVHADGVTLGLDQATPCGMVISEIVTNSIKHAFPQERKGNISINARLLEDDQVEFVVGDDGVGMPGGQNWRNPKSLGLKLVSLLGEGQLAGKVELEPGEGTCFRILFQRKGIGN